MEMCCFTYFMLLTMRSDNVGTNKGMSHDNIFKKQNKVTQISVFTDR